MMRPDDICLFICGSPRRNGRCAELVAHLSKEASRAKVLYVGDLDIAGCTGCDVCRACVPRIVCAKHDDMGKVYELLGMAKSLTLVAPLYFAGPPSQLKALLDRLQPFFWANTRHGSKKPARLIVLGEGGDPHGAEPLITIVRSALAVAGFSLDEVEVRIGSHA